MGEREQLFDRVWDALTVAYQAVLAGAIFAIASLVVQSALFRVRETMFDPTFSAVLGLGLGVIVFLVAHRAERRGDSFFH